MAVAGEAVTATRPPPPSLRSTLVVLTAANSRLRYFATRITTSRFVAASLYDVTLKESAVEWSLRVLKAAHVALQVHGRWL